MLGQQEFAVALVLGLAGASEQPQHGKGPGLRNVSDAAMGVVIDSARDYTWRYCD